MIPVVNAFPRRVFPSPSLARRARYPFVVKDERPSLKGPSLGITTEEFLKNGGIAAGGIGLLFLSGALPDEVKAPVAVAGLGLVGYSVYKLFFSEDDTKEEEDDSNLKKVQPADLVRFVSGNITYPGRIGDGGPDGTEAFAVYSTKVPLFDGTYKIRFSLTSLSEIPIEVEVQFVSKTEKDQDRKSDLLTVTLPPGGVPVQKELKVPTGVSWERATGILRARTSLKGQWPISAKDSWKTLDVITYLIA